MSDYPFRDEVFFAMAVELNLFWGLDRPENYLDLCNKYTDSYIRTHGQFDHDLFHEFLNKQLHRSGSDEIPVIT